MGPAVPDHPLAPAAAISPLWEMGAYEALWSRPQTSFQSLAELFADRPDALPSDFVEASRIELARRMTLQTLAGYGVRHFGVRVAGAGDWPAGLADMKAPPALLYYRGAWEQVFAPAVAVIGTRRPTPEGVARAGRVARLLVRAGYTVVSGLAAGIDTAAHTAALATGGRTTAVIGTHIGRSYPASNKALQNRLAREQLLISPVPVLRTEVPKPDDPKIDRSFFLERNQVMTALCQAVVVVEAAERSGTAAGARVALAQGRRLLLLQNLFEGDAEWPQRLVEAGAVRVGGAKDLLEALGGPAET